MKKKWTLWIVITLISLVFIISYKTLLEKPKFFVEEYSVTESFITKEQLLEDYDMMWKLIEDNYPFLNAVQYAAYGPELDWPKLRDNNREIITNLNIDYFSYEMVYELLSDVIKPFQGIGHLVVIDSELYSMLITVFSDERTHNLMPLSERIYKQLMNPQAKKFYGELSKLNNNENLQFNLKDEIEEDLYQKVSDSVDTWVKDEIAYVSIAKFWSEWELGEMLIEILQQFFEENKGAEHIIIDIQGNPGGNTMVWERGIILPLWQEPLENYSIMGMLSGDLNRFFWAGDLPDISDLDEIYTADDLTGQHLFPEFEITNVEEMDYIKIGSVRIENRPEEALGFDGKVWLLIDDSVYSAADALAHFSKGSGFATLVGTRTLGGGVGSQPYVMSLPNSGLSIYYDAFLGLNHDGTVNGIMGMGTPPDIEVQEGQTALEVVLEEISRLRSLP